MAGVEVTTISQRFAEVKHHHCALTAFLEAECTQRVPVVLSVDAPYKKFKRSLRAETRRFTEFLCIVAYKD